MCVANATLTTTSRLDPATEAAAPPLLHPPLDANAAASAFTEAQ